MRFGRTEFGQEGRSPHTTVQSSVATGEKTIQKRSTRNTLTATLRLVGTGDRSRQVAEALGTEFKEAGVPRVRKGVT